jgi:hypothetical protein
MEFTLVCSLGIAEKSGKNDWEIWDIYIYRCYIYIYIQNIDDIHNTYMI